MSKRKRSAEGEYEQVRKARMEENRKRMLELGISDLSKSMSSGIKRKYQPRKLSSYERPLTPSRRSARLQSVPAPSYCEVRERGPAKERPKRDATKAGTGGSRPEIYTEEHEKLLGYAKEEWKLFVDGYKKGVRIYDPANGKTCHQCRQKTIGLRTFCNACESLQGQFCGDCLYMRYGENVKEVNADQNWKCPVCRDICNCSICRTRKGWAPTGCLYRRAIHLGYKSVAHFLVLTRRGTKDNVQEVSDVTENSDVEENAANNI